MKGILAKQTKNVNDFGWKTSGDADSMTICRSDGPFEFWGKFQSNCS